MAFADEFGEPHDDEPNSPPLPPEDRLWRHPSELGDANLQLPLDPVAIRRRWLLRQPSRASAWSAGVVGALLATGLVALGTHLAGALAGSNTAHDPASDATVTTAVRAAKAGAIVEVGLGSIERAALERVGASVVEVSVADGATRADSLGVIVHAPSGDVVLTSSSGISAASSFAITLANHVTYLATLLGLDRASGLACLHVKTTAALPAVALPANEFPTRGETALTVSAPGAGAYAMGTVRSTDGTPVVGGTALVDALTTDLPSAASPRGAAVIDTDGDLIGLVAGYDASGTVVTPSWVAAPVTTELAELGVVANGWLGVVGTTVSNAGEPAGVRLVSVVSSSAAAQAGLRPGDEVLDVDRTRVTCLPELKAILHTLRPGQQTRLVIERDGRRLGVNVVLGTSATS